MAWRWDLGSGGPLTWAAESFIPSYTCLSACPGAHETASTCLGKQARGFSAPDSRRSKEVSIREMSVACGSPQSPVLGSACQTGAAPGKAAVGRQRGRLGREVSASVPKVRYSWTWTLQKEGRCNPLEGDQPSPHVSFWVRAHSFQVCYLPVWRGKGWMSGLSFRA